MKFILTLLCLLSLSCSSNKAEGIWKLDFILHNQKLPIALKITPEGKNVSAILYNGEEEIELEGELKDDQLVLHFSQSYAKLSGQIKNGVFQGHWIRTNKDDFKIPFTGKKIAEVKFLDEKKDEKPDYKFSGEWKIQLSEDRFGLGVFKQQGNYIKGSILTETGDYRYLYGYIDGQNAHLYGLDGVFSFVIKINLEEKAFTAQMYSGTSEPKVISGTRDSEFKLADPANMTVTTTTQNLPYQGKSISGENIDFKAMPEKLKIVQIFGSWCPNCIDETRFFLNWKKENPKLDEKIQFVAVAFERVETKKQALKNLIKLQKRLSIDYPIVLADYNNSVKVEDIFPIDKNRAFPTTLFVNKENKIVKIHTGFAGQATAEYFDDFKKEFQETIESML
ncbi:MAG: hypothetical protein CME62_04855 [Halobacteriovoraceae bacterium]|nr:hypothetical protein [Halobacteriovoraceae bacterium]|tara:strand:- start:2132 stop:3310 length:1179 start_codon:yes stop_codon:yes gene_type:complete